MDVIVDLSKSSLRRLGSRFVEIILYRTAWGVDKDGKQFPPYSSRPFKMPAGAIPRRARKALLKSNQLRYFKRNKMLWVVVMGGYSALKQQVFSKTSYDGTPNLMLTGRMLGSFEVIRTENNKVRLGFARVEEANKAFWNKERGRDILGLTDEDFDDKQIKEIISGGLLFK